MKFYRMMSTSIVLAAMISLSSVYDCYSHSVWTKRNEPGSWTVTLYHCDEETGDSEFELIDAGGSPGLNLICEPDELAALESVSSKAWYLDRAINSVDVCQLISEASVEHPSPDMSIEMWMKVTDMGADIQVGFIDGISMRVCFSNSGDLFSYCGPK